MTAGSSGSAAAIIRRGQIFTVELDPVVGSEQGKVRPAVVVSNNAANDAAARTRRGVVTVVPITSNVARIFPFQTELQPGETGLPVPSKAQAEQLRSVAVERLVRPIGWVDGEAMRRLDEAIALHLALF